MTTAKNVALLCLLILCSLAAFGCSEKKEAVPQTDVKIDESRPISEVKAEAEKMDAEQLRAVALKYRQVIEAKTAEVEELAQQLMKTMVADKSGDKTKQLNAQMKQMNESVEALTERFEVYYKKLEEKGGDLSGLRT